MSDKQPWEWEKIDIEQMISAQKQEDINLDYKASDSLDKADGKKKEISKDVSAFANSDGGVIIYGVSENPSQKYLPEKIDAGLNPTDISKEWLEQVINSGVKPKIQGLRIKQIMIGPGKVIYVVSIPKSITVHQAADNRYYKRYNFQSVAMEHYEIMDVLNRTERTDLEPDFFFVSAGLVFHFVVLLTNCGKKVIHNFSLELSIPTALIKDSKGESFKIGNCRNLVTVFGERAYEFTDLTFRNDNEAVIFPKQELKFIDPNYQRLISIFREVTADPTLFMHAKMYWQLYADDMPVKSGELKVCEVRLRR